MDSKRQYSIVRGDGGGYWNVVDCTDVHNPRNGQIVRVSHKTRQAAREALQAALDDYYGRAAEAEMDSRSYQEEEDDDQE